LWRSVLNAAMVALVTKAIQVPLLWLYRELVLGPRLSRPEEVLPHPSSALEDVCGVRVHHISAPSPSFVPSSGPLVLMNHGFGACCLSWLPVLQPLSDALGGTTLAHDSPGFGLTERRGLVSALLHGWYSLERNAELTASLAASRRAEGAQLFIFGHSMGALSAALAAADERFPPKCTTLVLVAPALSMDNLEESQGQTNGRFRVLAPFLGALRSLTVLPSVLSLPFVMLGLRFVYNGSFWRSGLRQAWYRPEGVDVEVVNRYRWPSLVKKWDMGLALFTLRRRRGGGDGKGYRTALRHLQQRCKEGLKVIIIHGKQDRIIPYERSVALASLLPGALVVGVDECGHVPHEEMEPLDFVSLIVKHQ
jgi:pimeloyl-ACP methyl ester carboxylesterase